MNIDKNYFLSRLNAGEKIDIIGQELAALMTDALNEYEAEQKAAAAKRAEAEKEEAKRDLVAEMVEIIQELAILEGMDPDDFVCDEEDVQELTEGITNMFRTLVELKRLLREPVKPAGKSGKSDDEILTNFITSLM